MKVHREGDFQECRRWYLYKNCLVCSTPTDSSVPKQEAPMLPLALMKHTLLYVHQMHTANCSLYSCDCLKLDLKLKLTGHKIWHSLQDVLMVRPRHWSQKTGSLVAQVLGPGTFIMPVTSVVMAGESAPGRTTECWGSWSGIEPRV